MTTNTWHARAKRVNLNIKTLAALTGADEWTITRYFRGDEDRIPRYVQTIVVAWESLTGLQQAALLDAVNALPPPRKIKRADTLNLKGGKKAGAHDQSADG